MGNGVTYAPVPERMKWYLEARFGMSLHFGLYSIPARGEWIRAVEQLTVEQYQKYFDTFQPDPGCATEWARLAKRAGARYCVLTTKHHDGFCLFDSALTDYKAPNTPARRDLIREYVDALRAEGIRVGLYYSLVDWHHPDYPAYSDRQHPLRHDPASRERDKNCIWERYVKYLHGQVEELLTNYGKIDLLVFDFSYWDLVAEKWGASDLTKRIRELQPDLVMNDRMSREGIKSADPPPYVGDFDHAEQDIPRRPIANAHGQVIPWESWFTTNNSWCANPQDRHFKESGDIIRALVNCVSKGGNLCLNVGPDARGHIPAESAAIFEGVGDWLAKNGESIYGCGIADFPKPEWGRFTQRGRRLYAHVMDQVIGHITLPEMRGRVKNARVVATGAEAILCDYWNPGMQTFDGPDDIFMNFGAPVAQTFPLPDRTDTVVSLELTTEDERAQLLKDLEIEFERATARVPVP